MLLALHPQSLALHWFHSRNALLGLPQVVNMQLSSRGLQQVGDYNHTAVVQIYWSGQQLDLCLSPLFPLSRMESCRFTFQLVLQVQFSLSQLSKGLS